MNLKDRVVLITGSGSGIGECMALSFAEKGCIVVANDVNPQRLAKLSKRLEADGRSFLSIRADVSVRSEVDYMISKILDGLGTIDVLINNAGIMTSSLVVDLNEADWDRIFSVNLKGTFLCSKACAPLMIQNRRGKIINIASIAGEVPRYGLSAYCAAKAGIIQFSKVLALELASYGINVNVISPGTTKTPMLRQHPMSRKEHIAGDLKNYRLGIPLGKLAKTEDIAAVAIFLCSDQANHITGQVISVDGGQSIV